MPRHVRSTLALVILVLVSATAIPSEIVVPYEIFTLPNGLTIILHEDHTLPQVAVNTWFYVGSKDDPPERSGFAHLFEHLMFMGTERVPGSGYDDIMEAGGGANNASTGMDRTNYYTWGPSSLLPTLLWLDADRLDGLGRAMTQEKLDLQRDVVLNERRENYENAPYNKAYIIIPKAIYPLDHPYHLSGIGEPEHLEAATLEDVVGFFNEFYVPSNASLVVAGDFDKEKTRELILATFGAVAVKPAPAHLTAPPVSLKQEVRRIETDRVDSSRLYLVWPSPPIYSPGDAEMDLVAAILADGPSSRLYRRLVIEDAAARDVEAYQASEGLGSMFFIEATAATGGDLELMKRAILDEIVRFQTEGPTAQELERVKAASEASFLRRMENLNGRADSLNGYRYHFGEPDGFARDLARWTGATRTDLQQWSIKVLTQGRLDLRILPEAAVDSNVNLDRRPADWESPAYQPPRPEGFTLSNGIEVALVSRPGSGLFAGALLADGGERIVPTEKSGLASLAASMLTSGANSRSAVEYADAVASLGAEVAARASWHDLQVHVRGLTSRLDATLDLFADAILRPSLEKIDFDRERRLAIERIRSRGQDPNTVAYLTARAMVWGREDPRGRPTSGYEESVATIALTDMEAMVPQMVHPSRSRLVFVGDVDAETLRTALDPRFGTWQAPETTPITNPPPITETTPRIAIVDRPGAPQTVIFALRPVPAPEDGIERIARRSVNTIFGATFTSRLMRNLREQHGYTYHAGSGLGQSSDQFQLYAYSAVQAEVTAEALAEFKKEFDGLAGGDISEQELSKAISTLRYELVKTGDSTGSLASTLVSLAADGRPLESVSTDLVSLDGVSLEMVNDVASSGLYDWNELLIVLVGDAKKVSTQLVAAGFEPPQTVDQEGRPVEDD